MPLTEDMHRDNHYVPRSYLKRWARDGRKVGTYQLLVAHAQTPAWREQSTRGIAYHEHLHTTRASLYFFERAWPVRWTSSPAN